MKIAAALAFCVAAFNARAQRAAEHDVKRASGVGVAQATDGRFLYRGGPGTKAFQRAALKKRNKARHRAACRA